jgi:hypothetical protein
MSVEDMAWGVGAYPPTASDFRSTYRALRRLRDQGLVEAAGEYDYGLTSRGERVSRELWPGGYPHPR